MTLSVCGRRIIFAVIIGIIIYIIYINQKKTIENFNPYLDYPRAYPSTFALNRDYLPYDKSFYMFPDGVINLNYPINARYSPGYRDYAYIPKHEYLKNWTGLNTIPTNCMVPTSISEYCVNEHMNENGNLDLAIRACVVPASVSESCGI